MIPPGWSRREYVRHRRDVWVGGWCALLDGLACIVWLGYWHPALHYRWTCHAAKRELHLRGAR